MKEFIEVEIKKGTLENLEDCKDALINSELGKRYFTDGKGAEEAICEGLDQDCLYVAIVDNTCVGFMYYIPNGAFHAFSYLHIIAIKPDYRGRGIGTCLVKFLENLVLKDKGKVFLVVADFNPEGRTFYESLGYSKVGEIPSLYREGITEYLMMKAK